MSNTFKLPENDPAKGKLPPPMTSEQTMRLHITILATEIDRMNTHFKTVNSCFLALAEYNKIPPAVVAKILSNPKVVEKYESDVVTEIKKLATDFQAKQKIKDTLEMGVSKDLKSKLK